MRILIEDSTAQELKTVSEDTSRFNFYFKSNVETIIKIGEEKTIRTGLIVENDKNQDAYYYVLVYFKKHGIISGSIVSRMYAQTEEEIKVTIRNTSNFDYVINVGDTIGIFEEIVVYYN